MTEDQKFVLKDLYPGVININGPYHRKDGRKHVVLTYSDKQTSLSYPKALVEIKYNRRLLSDETVDHNDRDKTNDSLENLIVRNRSNHSSLDAKRRVVKEVNCPECGTSFIPTRSQLRKDKAGPFCSKRCTGKYGQKVRMGGSLLDKTELTISYVYLEK